MALCQDYTDIFEEIGYKIGKLSLNNKTPLNVIEIFIHYTWLGINISFDIKERCNIKPEFQKCFIASVLSNIQVLFLKSHGQNSFKTKLIESFLNGVYAKIVLT